MTELTDRALLHSEQPSDNIAAAVYSYLQARRSLGDLTVNTIDIALALELTPGVVETAIEEFDMPGVKAQQ